MWKKQIITVGTCILLMSCAEKQDTIKISGAWALFPMVQVWAAEYQKLHPEIFFDISAGGAGKGMTDTLSGLVDIGMISRSIYEEELKKGVIPIAVCKDAVVCIINAQNPSCKKLLQMGLTQAQLKQIWLDDNPDNLNQILFTGKNKINVYTRSDAAGAPETWAQYLGQHQEDLKGIGVFSDPGIVEAVKRDKYSIGYCNLNYAYDNKTKAMLDQIIVIPIDSNNDGKISQNESLKTRDDASKSIELGIYPSPPARDLYFIAKGEFNPLANEFKEWVLSEGQKYLKDMGYIKIK